MDAVTTRSRMVFAAAAVVIALAGLKVASPVILPVLAAAFVAMLALPTIHLLHRRGMPTWAAITTVSAVAILGIAVVLAVIGVSVDHFVRDLPRYEEKRHALMAQLSTWMGGRGLATWAESMVSQIDPASVMSFAGESAQTIGGALMNIAFVCLLVAFMIAESTAVPAKMRAIFGTHDGDEIERWSKIVDAVNRYTWIKTLLGLLTAVVTAVVCWLFGVSYPILWGLIAFLLNFLPAFGGLIASIPPILLAVVDVGLGAAVGLSVALVVINGIIGNVVEPYMMGRSLGMSPLVVLISMVFWTWMWGPLGMLLSVPLTMIFMIVLDNTPDLRWVSIALGTRKQALVAVAHPGRQRPLNGPSGAGGADHEHPDTGRS